MWAGRALAGGRPTRAESASARRRARSRGTDWSWRPGAWAPGSLLADLGLPLVVSRQAVFWFRPTEPAAYALGTQPVFVWERPGLSPYGFPCIDEDGGVKIGLHHRGPETDPDHVVREVSPQDAAEVADLVRPLLPTLPATFLRGITCLYTTTPDHDFVIGRAPRARERRDRVRVLRPRLQVRAGRGGDPGRPGARRVDPAPDRAVRPDPLRLRSQAGDSVDTERGMTSTVSTTRTAKIAAPR